MARKKVIGPAGRYGTRYGVSVRKGVKSILLRRYSKHVCPFCGARGTVYRISTGMWKCRKCENTWAGAAYTPFSELAVYIKKPLVKEWT